MSSSMSMCVFFSTVFQHNLFSCVCHSFPLSYHFIWLYFPPVFSGLRVAAASSSFPTETSFSCGTQRDRSASGSRWCNTITVTSTLCSSCTTSPARPASAAWPPGWRSAGRTHSDRKSPGGYYLSVLFYEVAIKRVRKSALFLSPLQVPGGE